MYGRFCSYFETYGTIPELSVGQTEEKFAALRKAADGTISKGEYILLYIICIITVCYYCVL